MRIMQPKFMENANEGQLRLYERGFLGEQKQSHQHFVPKDRGLLI